MIAARVLDATTRRCARSSGCTSAAARTSSSSVSRGVSGARVIERTAPCAGVDQPAQQGGVARHDRARVLSTAPRGRQERPLEVDAGEVPGADQGEQRADPLAPGASAGAETRLPSRVVVPCRRWWSAAARMPAASASGNPCPAPPWQCTSTSPGRISRPGSAAGRSSAVPGPGGGRADPGDAAVVHEHQGVVQPAAGGDQVPAEQHAPRRLRSHGAGSRVRMVGQDEGRRDRRLRPPVPRPADQLVEVPRGGSAGRAASAAGASPTAASVRASSASAG